MPSTNADPASSACSLADRSAYLESLTNRYEEAVFDILNEIDALGGTVKAIEEGWIQRQIADYAYDTALDKQSGEKSVIGVNKYVEKDEKIEIETHPYDPTIVKRQIKRLNQVRGQRDESKVQSLLLQLREIARGASLNIMPITIELVREGATMDDIVETLKEIWGTYRETPVF